jgi:hypothetical protein
MDLYAKYWALVKHVSPCPPEPRLAVRVLLVPEEFTEANMGRGILLWLLGVPIPVIILLWLFFGR